MEKRQRKAHIDRNFKHGRADIYRQHLEHLDSLMTDMKRSALRQVENKRTRSSTDENKSVKRRKQIDPVEQKLDEIGNMVQRRPTDHRASHRLKFLVHSLRLLRLNETQRQRLDQYLATSKINGWHMPREQIKIQIVF